MAEHTSNSPSPDQASVYLRRLFGEASLTLPGQTVIEWCLGRARRRLWTIGAPRSEIAIAQAALAEFADDLEEMARLGAMLVRHELAESASTR